MVAMGISEVNLECQHYLLKCRYHSMCVYVCVVCVCARDKWLLNTPYKHYAICSTFVAIITIKKLHIHFHLVSIIRFITYLHWVRIA